MIRIEWLMIDASHCKGPSPCGEPEAAIGIWAAQRGLNTKIHLAVDAHGLPVRVLVTQGPTADCTQAAKLIEGCRRSIFWPTRGYDTDAILEQAKAQKMNPLSRRRKPHNPKAL